MNPPQGDINCEQPFNQKSKFPAHLEYSFSQQSLSYVNSTLECLRKVPRLWQIVSKLWTASNICSSEVVKSFFFSYVTIDAQPVVQWGTMSSVYIWEETSEQCQNCRKLFNNINNHKKFVHLMPETIIFLFLWQQSSWGSLLVVLTWD